MKLRAIHQIEITSRCNLRCKYCVHPTMAREKQDMTEPTFRRAVEVAEILFYQHGHRELNLAGIGESTMHPQFLDFLNYARRHMPEEVDLILATNGVEVDDLLAEAMATAVRGFPGKTKVWVSLHRPEKAGPAVMALRNVGLLAGVSADPSILPVDWAGQVKWPVHNPQEGTVCPWLRDGMAMVASDGSVLQCCFDGSGASCIGGIWDGIGEQDVQSHSLCMKCHHRLPTLQTA